jgi:N-acetylneuraminic acid mutarotase
MKPPAVHYLTFLTIWAVSAPAEPAATNSAASKPGVPTCETVETVGKPHPRHEAAFISLGDKIYLLGGRRIQAADIYDTAAKTWTAGAPPPVEVHHFQPVVWEKKIWLVGAMTGNYPKEQALDHTPVYDPATDTWSRGYALPEDRRRGGAGALIHEGKLYVVCGIINGHWDGNVAWLDVCDLKTGEWRRLPDAPRARDHFQVAEIAGKLYAAGGRRTSGATKQVFNLTTPEVDVFDFARAQWSTLPAQTGNLPTPRAGSMSLALGPLLLVAGGESMAQGGAHAEIEALDTRTGTWSLYATFARGRHGSGLTRVGNALYVAAGSGNRGGSPELDSLERLEIPAR